MMDAPGEKLYRPAGDRAEIQLRLGRGIELIPNSTQFGRGSPRRKCDLWHGHPASSEVIER
jgi:hypothetical protein